MKTLPERPNIDHLRQQAKDLLVRLREDRPETTLSDAQTAVAEQYGFRTWPELKAEVDRLQQEAEGAAESPDYAAALAAAFGAGDVAGAMTPLDRGPLSRAWRMTTTRGRFLAVELFQWVSDDGVATSVRLLEAAAGAGVQVPVPVRASDGGWVAAVGDRRWRLYEWIDLGPQPMKPVTEAVATEVGRVLATLHGTRLPTDAPVSPYLTCKPTDAQWQELVDKARAAGVPWAPQLEAVLPTMLDAASLALPAEAAAGAILCHCNILPNTVRIGRGGSLVVTDWETVGALPPAWELGGVLVQWSTGLGEHWSGLGGDDTDVDLAAVRAVMRGYRVCGGSVPALDLSMFTTMIVAGLNWIAGRVNWAIDGADTVQGRRAAKELPGLLAHPLSRAKLEQVVDAAAAVTI